MREWRNEKIAVGEGKWTRGFQVTCRCGAREELLGQDMGARVAREQAPKKFRRMGWEIGRKPEEDRCPACVKARRSARPERVKEEPAKVEPERVQTVSAWVRESGVPLSTLVMACQMGALPCERVGRQVMVKASDFERWRREVYRPKPPETRAKIGAANVAKAARKREEKPMNVVKVGAEPVEQAVVRDADGAPSRTPTREQRRRVLEALDEFYPKPEQGYAGGMTDHKLAERLGVPRVWVRELREQLYGPEVVVDWRGLEARVEVVEAKAREVDDLVLKAAEELGAMAKGVRRELEALRDQMMRGAR